MGEDPMYSVSMLPAGQAAECPAFWCPLGGEMSRRGGAREGSAGGSHSSVAVLCKCVCRGGHSAQHIGSRSRPTERMSCPL